MGEFAASIKRSKAKVFQLQGGLAPLNPNQGLCPFAGRLLDRVNSVRTDQQAY